MRCIIWHPSTLAAQMLPIGYLISRLQCVLYCVLHDKHNRMRDLHHYKCKVFVYNQFVEDFPALYISVYLKSKPVII
jgi:hypothetical protein